MEYTKEFLLEQIAKLEKELKYHKEQIQRLEYRLNYANSQVEENVHEDQLELDCG